MEIVIVTVWLACGIGAAAIAHSKGRNGLVWLLLGLLIGPFALLIVGFMGPAWHQSVHNESMAQTTWMDDMEERVRCPFCAEWIMPEAKICRFCGHDIPSS